MGNQQIKKKEKRENYCNIPKFFLINIKKYNIEIYIFN